MIKNYHIRFPSKEMCEVWNLEFTGQFSDGYWENSKENRWPTLASAIDWWYTIATTSAIDDMPPEPCPFYLPDLIKTFTGYINSGDVWPYRIVGYYYNAKKFGNRIADDRVEALSFIAAGRQITDDISQLSAYNGRIEDALRSQTPQERKFLEFLQTLDFKREWKKVIAMTNQMQKILNAYYN